jgi:CubicO group peptidase (beta-lactamase class C family)
MSLEDLVAEDLPPAFLAGTGPDWKKIRVRHLLEHGSGIQDYINSAPSSAYLESARSYEDLLSTVSFKLRFQPGSRLDYSNTGYLILGKLLEARTGKDYGKLFAALAQSLGFQGAGLVYGPLAGVYGGTGVHPSNMEAVGNAFASARDLLRFLRALDGDELLSRATIERMLSPDPECAGGEKCDKYGLAFTLRWKEIEGRDWYLKTGHLKNVSTVIAKVPEGRLNVAIVSDRAGKDTEAVAKAALRTLVAGGCAPTL